MVQRIATVAFEGIEARAVDVQVQVAPGLPAFAVAECECQRYTARRHRRQQWNWGTSPPSPLCGQRPRVPIPTYASLHRNRRLERACKGRPRRRQTTPLNT